MPVKPVDTYLGEPAVLAVVFHTHTGLETQPVGKRACAYKVENLVIYHADQHRAVTPFLFAFAPCNNHLVEHEGIGCDIEVDFVGLAFLRSISRFSAA